MIKIINPLPEEVIAASEALFSNVNSRQNHLGSGSHGNVYKLFDKYTVKIFNSKAIRNEYLDYIYLEQLQGVPYVPILYGYSERKYMISEFVEGQNISDYLLNHKQLPPNFKNLLIDAIRCMFGKKIVPVDMKIYEHIFWNENTNTLKLIDFGVCDNCAHMSQEFIERMTQTWINDSLKKIDDFLIACNNSRSV